MDKVVFFESDLKIVGDLSSFTYPQHGSITPITSGIAEGISEKVQKMIESGGKNGKTNIHFKLIR